MKATLLGLALVAFASFSTACATDLDEDGTEELGETDSADSRPYCKDFDVTGKGGCARPYVELATGIPAFNGAGQPSTAKPGVWALTSCTPTTCVLYGGSGDLFTVTKASLVAAAKSKTITKDGAKHLRDTVIADRSMKYTSNPGTGKKLVAHPTNIPEPKTGGYAPPDGDGVGSNQSISGRGDPLVMWGVETPTGAPKSSTGFAGALITPGLELIDAGDRASGAIWVDKKGNAAADAKWALVWTPSGAGYVKQWVLMQVTPRDKSKKPYVLVSAK